MRTTFAATVLVVAIGGCGSSGGGPTPMPTPTATVPSRLFALAAVSSDPAAPQRTRLLSSDDLGATWQLLDQGGLADTTVAIAFADRNHGVAAGANVAQRTDDGGRTWSTQLIDPRTDPSNHLALTGVAIDPAGAAVALGNLVGDGFLNANGFESWLLPADGSAPQKGAVGPAGPAPVSSICISVAGGGVATGSFRFTMALVAFNTVLLTGDAGTSWTAGPDSVVKQQVVGWNGTACSGTSKLWLVGTASTGGVIAPMPPALAIAHSADGGATWVSQTPDDPPAGGLAEVSFVDELSGWAVGSTAFNPQVASSPLVVHTADGGDTWDFQSIPSEVHGYLTDVAFLDRNVGIVGGQATPQPSVTEVLPLLLVTEDGGTTWRQVELPSGLGYVVGVDVGR